MYSKITDLAGYCILVWFCHMQECIYTCLYLGSMGGVVLLVLFGNSFVPHGVVFCTKPGSVWYSPYGVITSYGYCFTSYEVCTPP